MKKIILVLFLLLPGRLLCPAMAEETEFEWYGYFKLDMAHDSAVSSHGNYILYVKPSGEARSTLNITARQTRLGLKVKRLKTEGKVEVDFYGSSPENKNALMLRYAYIEFPLGPLAVEAGQTADLISPLVPATINYSVTWGAGNIGYRRPQLKLIWRNRSYFVGVALGRNISGDLDGDTIVDGAAAGIPAVQGRLAFSPSLGDVKMTIGGSAHYGRCSCPSEGIEYANWSLGSDVIVVLHRRLSVLGEFYTGSNLGQYGGAIFNRDSYGGLDSRGGWTNFQYGLNEAIKLSFGAGMEDVDKASLQGVTDGRAKNTVFFGNGVYRLASEVELGLELSRWQTDYVNLSPGNRAAPADWRLQGAVRANF